VTVPEHQPQVVEVFDEALRRAAGADRAHYLDEACAGDPELRRRVERLLKAVAEAGSFLEAPAQDPSPTVDQPPVESPGTVIGPFKLIEQIGEGGMGTVWMAQQTEPVKRFVALKLIKAGMDSAQVIARFEAERQALALMDHPNIARVLDGGTTDAGRPYFVMDLVKGVPITRYCDEHHLTPRQRLELFLPVCQAVQHAHQKGIIHRDLKPSNVLVAQYDGKPVPKVIDFGVAKAAGQSLTDKTLVTGFGAIVGTLEYMSPEQAEVNQLDIDTRSDIYSLGVLLYELLTGSPPFSKKELETAGVLEMLRVIREQEPSKPSTKLSTAEGLPTLAANRGTEPAKLTRLVRGELDWIVMKALEKARNRRYETANGFAMDVQRYLADEPVQACPPSVGYRLQKFARRNKVGLAVACLVLFFIVLLGGIVGWGMRDRAAREHEIALESARKLALTEEGICQALDRGSKSRAELHAILKKPGGVQQLLNQPARWELLIKTGQGELTQAQQLAVRAEGSLDAEWTQAMDKLEQQLTSDQADYDLARRLEKIRLDAATSVDGGFDYRTAADEYSKAFAGFAVLTDDPVVVATRLASSPIKDQLVAALDHWAVIAFYLPQTGSAEQILAPARQAAPDPVWGDQLRQLKVWRDPDALVKLVAQAPADGLSPQLLHLVGWLLHNVDRTLMESWLRQAQADHPADFWLNFSLATALHDTNPGEAAGFYRVALAVRPGSIVAYEGLGWVLDHQGKPAEAIVAFRKEIKLDPKNARAHNNLGLALSKQGKLDEAVAEFRKATELNPNPTNADDYKNLGRSLQGLGKLDDAVAAYRKAIKFDPNDNRAYALVGGALRDQKQLDAAVAAYRKAIELNPRFAIAYYNLGATLHDQQKLDDAIAAYRRAIDLNPKTVNAHTGLRRALANKGWDLANHPDPKLRDPERAVELVKEAVELAPQSVLAWQYLGWIQFRAGNWTASIEALEKSCKLQPGGTGDGGQWIVLALAHAKLAAQEGLIEKEREHHKAQARRRYDEAVKDIERWGAGDAVTQAIRAFRVEAAELLGIKEKQK
jgi:serine/threonine protein kinase/tetratricopeptide (TPR) repeat protein